MQPGLSPGHNRPRGHRRTPPHPLPQTCANADRTRPSWTGTDRSHAIRKPFCCVWETNKVIQTRECVKPPRSGVVVPTCLRARGTGAAGLCLHAAAPVWQCDQVTLSHATSPGQCGGMRPARAESARRMCGTAGAAALTQILQPGGQAGAPSGHAVAPRVRRRAGPARSKTHLPSHRVRDRFSQGSCVTCRRSCCQRDTRRPNATRNGTPARASPGAHDTNCTSSHALAAPATRAVHRAAQT